MKKEAKKTGKFMDKKEIKIIAILAALSVLVFLVINIKNTATANAIAKEKEEQRVYEDWLVENCKCIEQERIKCSEGFELNGRRCENKARKLFTTVLKACSKYDCSGEIKLWDNETEKWGDESDK